MKILQVTLNASFSLQGLSSVLGEFQIPLTKIANLKNVLCMLSFINIYNFKGMWFPNIINLKIIQLKK